MSVFPKGIPWLCLVQCFYGYPEGLFIQSAVSKLGGRANMSDGQIRIKNVNLLEDM